MYNLLSPEFYVFFLVFLVGVFFSWFIPGWLALSHIQALQKRKHELLVLLLATPVGMSLWGFQAYIFGYLNLRFLTYVYLIICTYLFWKQNKANILLPIQKIIQFIKKQPVWLSALILLCSFIQIYSHFGSGLMSELGLPFYFVNSVDGVLHLAYIQEISQSFPPQEPGAIGLPLQNYHYWSDLVQGELIRIWKLPTIHVFFQYAPVLIATLTTVLFLKFISFVGGSRKAQLVGLFLLTFGGDAAYILTQILHGNWGADVSSLDSGVTFYFNIPQVYARFVFIAILFLLAKWWKQRTLKLTILLALLIASLFGFKVYYALYTVFGFCFVIGIELIQTLLKNMKTKNLVTALQKTITQSKLSLALVIFTALTALSIYLPVNSGAGGLTYSFFEWPHLLLSADNINYNDWFLRMQVYKAAGNTRNIIIFNLWAVFLTFVAVYGTRMLGMIPTLKTKNEHLKKLLLFFIPANMLFILLGLFTLQTSGGLNIFNFLIVPIFSFNLFTALHFEKIKNKIFLVPVIIVFIILSVPRSITQLDLFYRRYSTQRPDALITNDELEAYTYLRNLDSAVVQKSLDELYNYQTMYVAFMSGHPTYIGGISMLESHNQPTQERYDQVHEAFTHYDAGKRMKLLKEYGITHVLIPTEEYSVPSKWPGEPVVSNKTWTLLPIN